MSALTKRLRETQDDWPMNLVLLEREAADRIDRLEECLREVSRCAPDADCESFLHAAKDRHDFDDECPPFERWTAAIAKARALLGEK